MPREATKARKPKAAIERPTQAQVVASTVRPLDEFAYYTSNVPKAELIARYGGDVKVAQSRNSAGVAGTPLRVYRRTRGSKGDYEGRRLKRFQVEKLRKAGGFYASKAASRLDDIEEITDPDFPLVAVLSAVNIRENGYTFLENIETHMGLTGDAYVMKSWDTDGSGNRVSQWPTELWTLPPHYVRVIPDREKFVGAYIYGTGTENEARYDPTAICHIRRPNPRNVYYGYGDLQACLLHADISLDLAIFWKACIDNACQPGLVIHGESLDVQATIDQLKTQIERTHRGASKAATTAVLSGDITVDKWAMEKSDFSNLMGAGEVRGMIARAFDQPIELLEMRVGGLSDGKGVALHQWQKFGIKPRCRRIEDAFNAKDNGIVQDYRDGTGDQTLFVAFDDPVDQDEAANTDRATKLFVSNLFTRNQALASLGEDDQGEDGEIYAWELTAPPALPDVTQGSPDGAGAGDGSPEKIAADAGAAVQDTALNGAQVSELRATLADIAAGKLPFEMGFPFIRASFPLLPEEQIRAMLEPLKAFEPKPDPVEAARIEAANNPAPPPGKPPVPPDGKTISMKGLWRAY